MQDKKNLALDEVDVSRLAAIAKILKDTSHYHSSKFSDVDIALLLKLLNSWPIAMIFPGEHDLIWELLLGVSFTRIGCSYPAY